MSLQGTQRRGNLLGAVGSSCTGLRLSLPYIGCFVYRGAFSRAEIAGISGWGAIAGRLFLFPTWRIEA